MAHVVDEIRKSTRQMVVACKAPLHETASVDRSSAVAEGRAHSQTSSRVAHVSEQHCDPRPVSALLVPNSCANTTVYLARQGHALKGITPGTLALIDEHHSGLNLNDREGGRKHACGRPEEDCRCMNSKLSARIGEGRRPQTAPVEMGYYSTPWADPVKADASAWTRADARPATSAGVRNDQAGPIVLRPGERHVPLTFGHDNYDGGNAGTAGKHRLRRAPVHYEYIATLTDEVAEMKAAVAARKAAILRCVTELLDPQWANRSSAGRPPATRTQQC